MSGPTSKIVPIHEKNNLHKKINQKQKKFDLGIKDLARTLDQKNFGEIISQFLSDLKQLKNGKFLEENLKLDDGEFTLFLNYGFSISLKEISDGKIHVFLKQDYLPPIATYSEGIISLKDFSEIEILLLSLCKNFDEKDNYSDQLNFLEDSGKLLSQLKKMSGDSFKSTDDSAYYLDNSPEGSLF